MNNEKTNDIGDSMIRAFKTVENVRKAAAAGGIGPYDPLAAALTVEEFLYIQDSIHAAGGMECTSNEISCCWKSYAETR